LAAAAREQRRDMVDAHNVAAAPRHGDRRVATATGDVENAPAWLEVDSLAERLGDRWISIATA